MNRKEVRTLKDWKKRRQKVGIKDIKGVDIRKGDMLRWFDSDGKERINTVHWSSEKRRFYICNSYFDIDEYGAVEIVGVELTKASAE